METGFEYKLIRSRRKTLQVEVHTDCSIIVRAPKWCSMAEINRFVSERRDWIIRNLQKMQHRIDDLPHVEKYSPNELRALTDLAYYYIPPRAEEYAKHIGVMYKRITIRCQKTRWGSCSSKGNLNFNCLLMALPEDVRDYVIIHELCHLIHPDHSPAFWREVAKYCPDHKALRKQLREKGNPLFLRL